MRKIKSIILLPLILLTANIYSEDFFDSFDDSSVAGVANNIEFNGEINLGSELLITEDSIKETFKLEESSDKFVTQTSSRFTVGYQGDMADLTVVADLDSDGINISECYTSIYFDILNIETGLLKTIWGKGDKLHVVDLLNPINYNTYFSKDYLENKIAQPTLKVNVPIGDEGILELIYIPTFEADSIPNEGKWVPLDVIKMKTGLETFVEQQAAAAYAQAYSEVILTASNPIQPDSTTIGNATASAMAASLKVLKEGSNLDLYYPDTNTFSYGQVGARFTNSVNGLDYGLLGYYGYEREPTLTSDFEFIYNPMLMAGVELGSVLWGLNLRGEAALYFVENSDTTFNFVAGFDRDIPLHNVNVNIQIKGLDSDYMLVGKISDSFNHEKVTTSITGIYNLEDEDFMIKPEVSLNIGENIKIETSASIFSGDSETTLGQFDCNDSLSVNLKYTF